MIKKKFMKKAAMVSMAAALSLGCYVECVAAAVVQPAVVSEVKSEDETRSARLVWYYKEENGKKYRRLYDATNGEWLTDWILCE